MTKPKAFAKIGLICDGPKRREYSAILPDADTSRMPKFKVGDYFVHRDSNGRPRPAYLIQAKTADPGELTKATRYHGDGFELHWLCGPNSRGFKVSRLYRDQYYEILPAETLKMILSVADRMSLFSEINRYSGVRVYNERVAEESGLFAVGGEYARNPAKAVATVAVTIGGIYLVPVILEALASGISATAGAALGITIAPEVIVAALGGLVLLMIIVELCDRNNAIREHILGANRAYRELDMPRGHAEMVASNVKAKKAWDLGLHAAGVWRGSAQAVVNAGKKAARGIVSGLARKGGEATSRALTRFGKGPTVLSSSGSVGLGGEIALGRPLARFDHTLQPWFFAEDNSSNGKSKPSHLQLIKGGGETTPASPSEPEEPEEPEDEKTKLSTELIYGLVDVKRWQEIWRYSIYNYRSLSKLFKVKRSGSSLASFFASPGLDRTLKETDVKASLIEIEFSKEELFGYYKDMLNQQGFVQAIAGGQVGERPSDTIKMTQNYRVTVDFVLDHMARGQPLDMQFARNVNRRLLYGNVENSPEAEYRPRNATLFIERVDEELKSKWAVDRKTEQDIPFIGQSRAKRFFDVVERLEDLDPIKRQRARQYLDGLFEDNQALFVSTRDPEGEFSEVINKWQENEGINPVERAHRLYERMSLIRPFDRASEATAILLMIASLIKDRLPPPIYIREPDPHEIIEGPTNYHLSDLAIRVRDSLDLMMRNKGRGAEIGNFVAAIEESLDAFATDAESKMTVMRRLVRVLGRKVDVADEARGWRGLVNLMLEEANRRGCSIEDLYSKDFMGNIMGPFVNDVDYFVEEGFIGRDTIDVDGIRRTWKVGSRETTDLAKEVAFFFLLGRNLSKRKKGFLNNVIKSNITWRSHFSAVFRLLRGLLPDYPEVADQLTLDNFPELKEWDKEIP